MTTFAPNVVLFHETPEFCLWTGSAHPVVLNYEHYAWKEPIWFMTMAHALIAFQYQHQPSITDKIVLSSSLYQAQQIQAKHVADQNFFFKKSWEKVIFNQKKRRYPEVAVAAKRHVWRRTVPYEGWELSMHSAHAIQFPVPGENRIWTWLTAEHLWQASRFTDLRIIERIWQAKSSTEAKKIAEEERRHIYLPGWTASEQLRVWQAIAEAKVAQHPDVREFLLSTGERPLIYNSREDMYWGSGLSGNGLNQAGRIWMDIRKGCQVSEERICNAVS
jgi:ribA/ribD-fused uncharacterized protein